MFDVMTDAMTELGPISPEKLPSANSLSASADITVSNSFKKLPEKRRPLIRKLVTQAALTASAFSLLISSGCGNTDKSTPKISPEPTPISTPLMSSENPTKQILITSTPEIISTITSTPEIVKSFTEAPTSTREFWEEIEAKYGITISTAQDLQKGLSIDELANLDKLLSKLPKHFYSPDEAERKLNIQLSPRRASCCIYTDNERILIVDSTLLLERGEPESASETLAHEFTHLATFEIKVLPNQAGHRLNTPSAKIVEGILGGKLADLRDSKLEELRRKSEDNDAKDWEISKFFSAYHYGLSNIGEFIATMGSSYVMSKEYFYKMYGLFYDYETTDHLYEFMRENVFRGVEYEIPIYKTN